MPTTYSVIFLGTYDSIDLIEPTSGDAHADSTADNASALENTVYGSQGDPLLNHVHEMSPGPPGDGNGVYNQNNNFPEYFKIDGGTNQEFDASTSYNATITYADGTSSGPITAIVFQDTAGNTYWAPEVSGNSDQMAMEAAPIRSLNITTINDRVGAGLIANRSAWNVATCFTTGTMITTEAGECAIESLVVGDKVLTCDRGLQPIRWIGSRKYSVAQLNAVPNLRPIRIKACALGSSTPVTDLVVSPQHRIIVRSKIAQRMFSSKEILVAAKHLLEIDGIEIASDMTEVEYWHFMFDCHEIVLANGAEVESLYAGKQTLKSLDEKALEEIFLIFPQLRDDNCFIHEEARQFVTGRRGRKLAMRHLRNAVALIS